MTILLSLNCLMNSTVLLVINNINIISYYLIDTVIEEPFPTLLVVIASSTGQGDLPQNGIQFKEKIEGKTLKKTDLVMLCLGDSNYTTFMDGPHALLNAMLKAGIRLVDQIVEADDSNNDAFADATDKFIEGIDAVVRKWVDNELSESIEPVFHPLSSTSQKAKRACKYETIIEFVKSSDHVAGSDLKIPKMPEPAFEISCDLSDCPPDITQFGQVKNGVAFEPVSSPIYECSVLNGKRLTSVKAEKQAWEITLSLPENTRVSDNNRELHCGDCVALFTPNDPGEVNLALKAFGKNMNVLANGQKRPSWFPERESLKNLLEFYVELRTPVSKTMLGHLMKTTTNEEIKRRFGEFVSREGKDLYRALLEKQVTFIDLLVAFPLLKPPVSVLSYLKRLQRRWYSIANWIDYSSSGVESRSLRIAFTEISSPKAGLMTNQLARIIDNLKEHQVCTPPFYPSRKRIILECRDPPPNMFRLDETPDIPILMIAAGSGIAPFIGFLDRIASIPGKEAALLFGCRNEHSYIYKDALQKKLQEGSLKKLLVAMSRERNKKYVQDVLLGMLLI